MTKLRRFRAALGLLFSLLLFYPAILPAETLTETIQPPETLQALAANQQALEALYQQHLKQAEAPVPMAFWIADALKNGDEQVRRLVRQGENLQRRLAIEMAITSNVALDSTPKEQASLNEGEKLSPRQERINTLQAEITAIDDQLRAIAAGETPQSDLVNEQIATLQHERESSLTELLAVLESTQEFEGSKSP